MPVKLLFIRRYLILNLNYEWKDITKRQRFIIQRLIEKRIKFYPITLTPS